jgi:UDP-N-acetylglucosamine diphosphorylase/glucosamine-1-phosphate N-acetyltransferase
MQLILFDDHAWDNLLPLTFTRPVSDLRIGILTIAEKWERHLGATASFLTRDHLAGKYPFAAGEDNLLVNASLLPDKDLVKALKELPAGGELKHGELVLGARLTRAEAAKFRELNRPGSVTEYPGEVSMADHPWKIFRLNGQQIEADFELITRGRRSEKLNGNVGVIGPDRVFAEPGFRGEHFTINTTSGPVYLGRDSEVMEGSVIRGPFALCEESVVKLSAKIYGPTTIGPYCKAGGEINNAVFQANSNKAHDGFLGNAAIGEWCNLGADTNNSNLKNNYAEVRAWNYPEGRFMGTGLQFCGLIMGDHSKCGINTMFNTGTVVGVSANKFGSGFPRSFIPSFSWGGASGMKTYELGKALETASLVMERRGLELTGEERSILRWVYDFTGKYRIWD